MRKHHNKLYYSKYKVKTVFNLPGSLMFYPTTDQYLTNLTKQHPELPDLNFLADFIMKHRNSMRFRIQDKKAIFYSDKERSNVLINKFTKYWQKTEIVDPKYDMLGKDVIGCTKLPHGKFKYQVHLKKDAQQHISQSERQALWNLIERNEESCLVTNKYVLDYLIGKYPYCYHGYFYVSQEKMLTPIYMIAQKGIDKVIKFVKVKNESNKKTSRA
tara:strand:+ start:1840 stop:2484 length:645 start_codon:yes stop_codon:yes gene_type:complete